MGTDIRSGDVVVLDGANGGGAVGIVSQLITDQNAGHVLTLRDGCVVGVTASIDDVHLADEGGEGFVQLAYALIKMGSHVIEQGLINRH